MIIFHNHAFVTLVEVGIHYNEALPADYFVVWIVTIPHPFGFATYTY
nr:MAG TPA: hypothetical protein [Caudoviricetes sp.]